MKQKIILFFAGVATGALISFIVCLVTKKEAPEANTTEVVEEKISEDQEPEKKLPDGVTLFDEPGDIVNEKSFKVMQVIANDAALAYGKDDLDFYMGTLYLLINSENKYYYDDEIVDIPNGKIVRQVGIYKYMTQNGTLKTVPIVIIMDE